MSSSRPSTSKGFDPRIAQKEAIVTRHKSAQMKRQLRVKNRSMKHLTDLLKSPTSKSQTTKERSTKSEKSPSSKSQCNKEKSKTTDQHSPTNKMKLTKVKSLFKTPEKKDIKSRIMEMIEDVEYYPDKLKRYIKVKKVMLKPKHELRMVGGITGSVKRKYRVPLKVDPKGAKLNTRESKQPKRKISNPFASLSMQEAVRMAEDCYSLTDEDMMEILTCPSPVWWEDPPDDHYIEDAIWTRSPPTVKNRENKEIRSNRKSIKIVAPDISLNNVADISSGNIIIPTKSRSNKFLKKRSKLENVLGNIKNKANKMIDNRNRFNEDLVVICSNYRKEIDFDKINTNNEIKNKSEKKIVESKRDKRNSESDGEEIIFSDISMTEDELLNDLENMVIPVETEAKESEDCIIIDDEPFSHKNKDYTCIEAKYSTDSKKEANLIKNKRKRKAERNQAKELFSECSKITNELNHKSNLNEMPTQLPKLQKFSIKEEKLDSPISVQSYTDESNVESNQEDSISDTNVRFILEEGSNDNKTVTDKSELNLAPDITKSIHNNEIDSNILEQAHLRLKEKVKTHKKHKGEKSKNKNVKMKEQEQEFSEKGEEISINADNNGTLNDFYKKCKKVYQKRSKTNSGEANTDVNKNNVEIEDISADISDTVYCESCRPKTKKVNNENVKYCLKCSSIFDTKECTYCIKQSKTFLCITCKIKFCCEDLFQKHVLGHRKTWRVEKDV